MFREFVTRAAAMVCRMHSDETGAIRVKSLDASASKWSENASRSSADFGDRTEAAAEDWARNTAAAADTYRQAITSAGIGERFRRGVMKAGAQKFARKVAAVARERFSSGVAAAQGDYSEGVAPYLQVISGLTLSARKPRGDPANYRRVEEIGKALNSKRIAMLGGGS